MSSRYELVDGEKANYRVVRICARLGVSTSGFYEWRGRPALRNRAAAGWLGRRIPEAFNASGRTYGYRRVHAALARAGIEAGPELVRALIAELGLVPCQPRPYRVATTDADDTTVTSDLLGLHRRRPGVSASWVTSPTFPPGRAGSYRTPEEVRIEHLKTNCEA